ncbi:uncharacterized protein KQ657_004153 [Scheffersomyces spartinae]|uniref:Ketopantoate reductase C-terminal domain-containing protein n=1 Tax=Scheffersomyces spartinae TaxID=45513 RepID=A0A9P7VC75_9ASCO|nr:uncharacterized protein KQ657_004153 [Scheffersomyces spartinae]KAG7195040.1 hypothetical protein KQ657_004153 [Scheffersomyces spartinae]
MVLGANPNLVFYAWRLHKTYSVDVTIVSRNIPASTKNLNFISSTLGNESFTPYGVHTSLAEIPKGSSSFDIIFISASTLQGFQSLMTDLASFITPKETLIIVELSGFINLEQFVTTNFPDANTKNPIHQVCSIMNDSDIKQLVQDYTTFRHQSLSRDNRIYIGTSTPDSKLDNFTNFHRVVKLFQMVQHDSQDNISVLKTLKPKEFMTYQWKLALPRIIFNPLLVIFEIEYPEDFSQQILCKPLISGLVNELFKVIKKMDCKLVKGFENEASLLKNWSESYPKKSSNPDYIHCNQMFYDYYHGKTDELNIDVLLLQPILLADDNLIRTPYLENLYSMLCQLVKVNSSGSASSIFFTRKGDPSNQLQTKNHNNNVARYQAQEEETKKQLSQMDVRLNILNTDVKKLEGSKNQLEQYLNNKSKFKHQLDTEIEGLTKQLSTLQVQISESQLMLSKQEQQHNQQRELIQKQETYLQQIEEQKRLAPQQQDSHPHSTTNKAVPSRDSVLQRENLADLTDIALYGEQINNSTEKVLATPKVMSNQMPSREAYEANGNASEHTSSNDLHERELELQRREKSLMNREMALQQQQQNQQHNNRIPTLFNNYNNAGNGNGMGDQLPPHGLPANGMPSNAFPPNLTTNTAYPPQPQQHMSQQPMIQQGGSQRQTHGGSPNEVIGRGYPPQQMPPQGQQMPPQGQQMPPQGQQMPPQGQQMPPQGQQMPPQAQQMPPQGQQMPPQGQMPLQGPHNYSQSGSRMNSMTSQYFESYSGGTGNGQGGYYGQHPLFQNAAPIDPLVEQRFKQNPKKLNRRSQYPQISQGNMDGLDMGGRGGMPMPMSGMGSKRSSVGNALNLQGQGPSNGGSNGFAPSGPRRVSSAGNLLPVQASYSQPAHTQNNLVVPQRHGPGQSQPQQQQPQQQQQQQPQQEQQQQQFKTSPNLNGTDYSSAPDANAKPLGGISSSATSQDQPKKKGFFGRKK